MSDINTIVLNGNEYNVGGNGGGLTDDAKQALLACFEQVAWIGEDGQDYYDALESALYPPANLTRISCVYTQSGTVYDTDTLDSLKTDLVVTAHYDNGTTAIVTTYTLSGTLTQGTSTITVAYSGKTTTFTVNVTEAPPYTFYDYLEGDGTAFIDTGLNGQIYINDVYKKYVKYRLNALTNERATFGIRNDYGTTGVIVQNNASGNKLAIAFGNEWTYDTTPIAGDLLEVELNYPDVIVNGETIASVTGSTPDLNYSTPNILLFATWAGRAPSSTYYAIGGGYASQFLPHKIYRFMVTDTRTNTVVADMKPASRNSDNAIGMYDTIRDTFYQNARDTGSFTLGND